jgi:hypothetical protein
MRPIYFNFSIFGWLSAGIIFFFWGWRWFMVPGILLGLLGFFWRKEFYIWVFKKGLRKAGYLAATQELDKDEIIKYVILKEVD